MRISVSSGDSRRTAILQMPMLFAFALSFIIGGNCMARPLNGADALAILQKESFKLVDRVSEIPRSALVSANVIAPDRKLNSWIVNKNQEFQRGDASIDPDRPEKQIILAGISSHYLFLCFWAGGQVEARYFMLLKVENTKAMVVFYSTLDGEVRNFSDIKQLLRRNQISPLTFEPERAKGS